jgi:hypothetical protein
MQGWVEPPSILYLFGAYSGSQTSTEDKRIDMSKLECTKDISLRGSWTPSSVPITHRETLVSQDLNSSDKKPSQAFAQAKL